MDTLSIATTVLQYVPTSWLVYFALYMLVFYWLFVFSASAYQAWLNKKLSKLQIVLLLPPVLLLGVVDVIFNYTVASLVFMELPKSGEPLLSKRFQGYNAIEGSSWKKAVAKYVCQKMLNIFIMSEDHC